LAAPAAQSEQKIKNLRSRSFVGVQIPLDHPEVDA